MPSAMTITVPLRLQALQRLRGAMFTAALYLMTRKVRWVTSGSSITLVLFSSMCSVPR